MLDDGVFFFVMLSTPYEEVWQAMVRSSPKTLMYTGLIALFATNLFAQQAHTPDERFYPMVFKHALSTQQPSQNPAVAAPSMTFFSNQIGLRDDESTALLSEAQAWQADVAPIDKNAYAIIAAIRSRTPGGRLAPGETPPAPPQELKAMQAQKDSVTLKHVQHLQAILGSDRFTYFDQHIRTAAQGRPVPKPSAQQ